MKTLINLIKAEIISQFETREFRYDFRIPYKIKGTLDSFRITYDGTKEAVYSIEIAVDEDLNEYFNIPQYIIDELNKEL